MTIAYPDLSNHEGSMPLEAGTVATCAKATEGTTFKDAFYAHFRAEAARVGAVFFAYHFLHHGNGAAQAAFCHSIVGNDVAVMIDCEPTTGSNPTVQDCIDFATELRRLGGKCVLVYFPHWYWKNLGSPGLAPFNTLKLGLISSAYPASYSDTGEGWAPYGGATPVIWQFTDKLSYSGQGVDFNAYRGTVDQLKALLGYAPTAAPGSAPSSIQGDDMGYLVSVSPDPTGPAGNTSSGIFVVDGGTVDHVDSPSYPGYLKRFGDPVLIDTAQYNTLLSNRPATEAATVNVSLDAAALAADLGPALAESFAAHVGVAFTGK